MRRRRAERLAQRAEAAVEAGSRDEARQCLEEARMLAPALPEFERIEQKLSARDRGGRPAIRFSARGAVAALALAAATFAGAGLNVAMHRTAAGAPATRPAPDFRGVSRLADAAPLPDASDRASESRRPLPSPPATELAVTATVLPSREEPGSVRERTVPRAPVGAAPQESTRPPSARPAPSETSGAAFAAGVAPVALPSAPIPVVPEPAFPASGPAGVGETPSPTVALVSNDRPDEVVRRTLDRYAAAYSALDAEAAHRVWPRVDRAALTRAFDTLASQRVSLNDCRIDVTGAAAHASCSGSATWAPKIGPGGVRTDPRRWDFELAKNSTGWEIVRARTQNR